MEIMSWIAGFIKGCWTICIIVIITLMFATEGLWYGPSITFVAEYLKTDVGTAECLVFLGGIAVIYMLIKSRFGMD